jgi:hypothetical protein
MPGVVHHAITARKYPSYQPQQIAAKIKAHASQCHHGIAPLAME